MSPPRRPLHWAWLGRRPYVPVWHQQRAIREALLRGEGTETLLLVEHEPVITLGRRAAPATALRVPEPTLAGAGVEVHQVERGGEATWHGPGQLTGYPLVRLATLAMDVPTFVAALEQAMIDFVSCRGVACHRVPGRHGVWTAGGKIGAVGIHLKQLVTLHGFALNLTTGASVWDSIVPCGIQDAGVTSLEAQGGGAPSPSQAAREMAARVAGQLGLDLVLDASLIRPPA